MASLDEQFSTDTDDAENGRWFPIPGKVDPGQRPMRVKLRSVHSPTFRREVAKLGRRFRAQFVAGDGTLDTETQDLYDITLGSRALVVDWEGVYRKDSTVEVPAKPTDVQAILTEYPPFRRMLFVMAKMDENFRPSSESAEALERMAGNSERPSGTINA